MRLSEKWSESTSTLSHNPFNINILEGRCFPNFKSTRQFVFCLTLCHFVLVFDSHFSIAITRLGKRELILVVFVRFVLVWICRFPLPLGVWEGLRFVIVALPGLFSYLFSRQKVGHIRVK